MRKYCIGVFKSTRHQDSPCVLLLSRFSHCLSEAVKLFGSRRASATNSAIKPSQYCGSPYLPLTGLCLGRFAHRSSGAEFFRTLHLQQEVTRLSSAVAPPAENASM